MNLKNAALLLICGLSYTILHKAVFAVFPALNNSINTNGIFTLLWIAATSTLILFSYFFITEIQPESFLIRFTLWSIICFTAGIILLKIPFNVFKLNYEIRNKIFDLFTILNSVSILLFLSQIFRTLKEGSPLRIPSILSIIGLSGSLLVGLIAFAVIISASPAGRDTDSFVFFRVLSGLLFLFTYLSIIFFLIRFRKLGNVKDFFTGTPDE